MKNPEVTKQIPEFYQFVAAAEKLTPVEVTWGPEFFEGVSAAGAKAPHSRCRDDPASCRQFPSPSKARATASVTGIMASNRRTLRNSEPMIGNAGR